MYVTTTNPRGQPGSTLIVRFSSYPTNSPWDYNNLPPRYYNNSSILGGFTESRYNFDETSWHNYEFTDTFGQVAFTGPICTRSVSDKWKKVLGYIKLEYGDGIYMRISKSYPAANRPTLGLFNAEADIKLLLNSPDESPVPYALKNEYITFFDNPSVDTISAQILYLAGYMGLEGDMSNVWSPETISALGGPIVQGRSLDQADVIWKAVVPTLDEFKLYMGSAFLCGIDSPYRPVSTVTMPVNKFFLTSTPSQVDKTKFIAINADGVEEEAATNIGYSVYLIIKPFLKTP